jgi:hypothetical protein
MHIDPGQKVTADWTMPFKRAATSRMAVIMRSPLGSVVGSGFD